MSEHCMETLEALLADVPAETILLPGQSSRSLLMEEWRAQTDGRGRIDSLTLYPGITLAWNYYLAQRVRITHKANPRVLEINHCRSGRSGWAMEGGLSLYLGPGDLTLHMTDCCAHTEMSFPLGFYEGITISIDLDTLTHSGPELLREAGISGELISSRFSPQSLPLAMPANEEIRHIFSELYTLPEAIRIPYCKLKVQELLLFLSTQKISDRQRLTPYPPEQIHRIEEIHTLLTEHLDCRYTIEELSRRYLINTSSLKEIFKSVYGLPIASYMKEYRMHEAMRLLRETDDSIASIASAVGYESQGKFAKAFKDAVHLSPTQYRKQ